MELLRDAICEKCHRAYKTTGTMRHICPDPEYAHRAVTEPKEMDARDRFILERGPMIGYTRGDRPTFNPNDIDFSPKYDKRPTLEDLQKEKAPLRKFETGATRDTDEGKLDLEAFFSPAVLIRRADFMHKNRELPTGELRAGDNWQAGIPKDQYMKSLLRHVVDVWSEHRGIKTSDGMENAICAAMFNLEGLLFEILKEKQ